MTVIDLDKTHTDFCESFANHVPKTNLSFRNKADEQLNALSFPTSREENWKYTRLSKLSKLKLNYQPVNNKLAIDAYRIDPKSNLLVFVNGFFQEELSSIKEQKEAFLFYSKSEITTAFDSSNKHYFAAFCDRYFADGFGLEIKTVFKHPIEVLFFNEGEAILAPVKIDINCKAHQAAELIFSHHSTKASGLFAIYTNIQIEENAQLTLNTLQNESDDLHHIQFISCKQQNNSVFSTNTFSLSGKLIRNDLQIASQGENTESNLYGLYLLKADQLVDNHTVMDHQKANCLSNELYKGVIDDKATAVFNGKVFVRKDAQKINAFQSNANILLSDDATINSKPELEIYADDVKCSHGSTTGQLDDEALFYLRARGIGEQKARQLLITAFASDVLEFIKNESVSTHVESKINDYFEKH